MSVPVYKWSIIVRLGGGKLVYSAIYANNMLEAKDLAEEQYGAGRVTVMQRIS
jgi:hypothetical protein